MTDLELKKNVESELNWEPSVNAAEIGVGVKNGIVTLTGHIPSYSEKWASERAAGRVLGVKAVANELEVRLASSHQRSDEDIARAAVDALRWSVSVPPDRVKVKVSNGWITLEGTVDWQYQKTAAEDEVRNLIGVKGVSNLVTITPRVSKGDVKAAIQDALKRNAQLDADRITVETAGDKVTLRGTVRSWVERDEAEDAAWRAPGVHSVDDRIDVSV